MDFSNKFGLKKSIKSRFENDLDRILAGGRLDRMSLPQLDDDCSCGAILLPMVRSSRAKTFLSISAITLLTWKVKLSPSQQIQN